MTNQPDSTPSHPLLNTLHATWLEEEKTRWLEREVITQDEYDLIPSRVGYIRKLIPETKNSASARRHRDVCIIPTGQRIPTLLIEAGTRQDKNFMLDNLDLCFRTFEGKLQKAIFFIWEFFPDDRVSLDLEVYSYDAGREIPMLLQKIRVIPTEQERSGYVELPVSFREIFGTHLPEDLPVAGNVRVLMQDLRNTADENLLSSELEPANIQDCLPDPVDEQPKLYELPSNNPKTGNQPEGTDGNTGEPKDPIPETMVDYLTRYFNNTRHLSALFPADDPRLEELARNAHTTMPETLKKLGLDQNATGSIMDTAIYDVAIFGDDSGSMRQAGRYDALSAIASRFIPIAADISHVGVSVRFINSKVDDQLDEICEPSDIANIFDTIRPGGFTPIGTKLREKIINPFLNRLQTPNAGPFRPKLVVIITDGEPSKERETALKDAIIDCKKSLDEIKNPNGKPFGSPCIVFCLSIVGDSADAAKYVRAIADDPELKEMVYCDLDPLDQQISSRNPNLNLVKLLKAAIDKA